jgi:hypothetical protein
MAPKRDTKQKREKREKREKKERKEQDGGKREQDETVEDETVEDETVEGEKKPVVEEPVEGETVVGGAGAAEAAINAYGGPGQQHAELGKGNAIAVNLQGGKGKKGWLNIPSSFLSSNKMYKKRTNKTKKNKGKKSRRTYRRK